MENSPSSLSLTPPDSNSALADLIKYFESKRGTPKEWLQKETALSKFIAQFDSLYDNTKRIFCKGEYYGIESHYPAILGYDVATTSVEVWIPAGDDCQIILGNIHYFHSKIPHSAIAREVYEKPQNNSTI